MRRRRVVMLVVLLLGVGTGAGLHIMVDDASIARSPTAAVQPRANAIAVAVRPFVDLDDTADPFMSRSLTTSLVHTLGSQPPLTVVDADAIAHGEKPPQAMQPSGSLPVVHYVLQGSVGRAEEGVRVTVQLVDAAENSVLWSRRWHGAAATFFALEQAVVVETSRHLDLRIAYGEGDLLGGTHALDAWLHYLQGRRAYERFSPAENARAREHFEAALAIDPDFADAMVALAKTHLLELGLHPDRLGPVTARIDALARSAASVAPTLPHLLELRAWSALAAGDLDNAVAFAEVMAALYPRGAESNYLLGQMAFFAASYPRAARALQRAREANPRSRPSYDSHLAFARLAEGDLQGAVALAEATVTRWPHYPVGRAYLAIFYELAGRRAAARSEAALLQRIAPEFALETLRRRFSPMTDRDLASRFIEAARRAGLPGS